MKGFTKNGKFRPIFKGEKRINGVPTKRERDFFSNMENSKSPSLETRVKEQLKDKNKTATQIRGLVAKNKREGKQAQTLAEIHDR